MEPIGLWHITDSGPSRLLATELGAERDLENWIERDPALLERGLVIVGRQIRLEGGPLDLLALDPQGRWVLIEIKRERLRRDVIAQAIDYASCLHDVDPDWLRQQCDAYLRSKGSPSSLDDLLEQRGQSLNAENDGREVLIYLVGTGLDPGLERMIGYLEREAELMITLVTFSAFRDSDGRTLLARKIHEQDEEHTPQARRPTGTTPAAETILAMADQNGVGAVIRRLHEAAVQLGLHVRPWGRSIMFAPQHSKKRCLFTVWADRRPSQPGAARVYIAPDKFEQFYEMKEADVIAALGPAGFSVVDLAGAERLAAGLRQLFAARSGPRPGA